MQEYVQLLMIVIVGVALLSFGFTLFIGQWAKMRSNRDDRSHGEKSSNDFQACPICSSKLKRGDLVKTLAFPSITGGKDRLMHIRGCAYCINGRMQRNCPICGASLGLEDILVARIFERPHRRAHVHITGCNKCRRVGTIN
jgi:endogenous inhibitor of DNA gyrase (YacG/DUF329 family)